MSSSLQILTTTSLTDVVMQELEAMIVRGDIVSGERISEAALAKRLGISRAPVREACRALTQAGLLVAIRNRGVFVNTISLKEALDLYEVRALIEAEMAAKVAQSATPALKASLRKLVASMEDFAAREEGGRYYETNLAFHQFIADNCDNAELQAIYRSASIRLHIYRKNRLRSPSNMVTSNKRHGELVAAIEAGDAEAARNAMRSHILLSRDWYEEAGAPVGEAGGQPHQANRR